MARLEIEITDVGILEIGDETNSPLRLNKRLSDISLLTKRSDVYTYDFEVLDSKQNKSTLQYYYHYKYNNYINIDEEKTCVIKKDGRTFLSGKVRIKSSTIVDGIRTFSLQFSGGNISWWAELKNYTLADLDWSGLSSFTMFKTSVSNSWARVHTDGYVMSLIDRGKKGNLDTELVATEFRPDLNVWYILSKIENILGITFDSALFDHADFKKLVLSYFTKVRFGLRDDVLDLHKAITNNTIDNSSLSVPASDGQNIAITVLDLTNTGTWADVIDVSNLIDTSGVFVPSIDGIFYVVKCNINIEIINTDNKVVTTAFYIYNVTDNVIASASAVDFGSHTFENEYGVTDYSIYTELKFVARLGKTYRLVYTTFERHTSWDSNNQIYTNNNWYGVTSIIKSGTRINFDIDKDQSIDDLAGGVVLSVGDVVDNEMTLFDIFNDWVRMFHLFSETDLITNVVTIEPRNDFYKSITNAEDLTDRLDTSKSIKVTPNSILYKRYLDFKYKEDSNDGKIVEYNKNQSTDALSYRHDYGTKFTGGNIPIHTKVMASTLMGVHWNSVEDNGDSSIPPVTARYWSDDGISAPPFKELQTPRTLNYVYGTQSAQETGVNRTFKIEGTTYSTIPACLVSNAKGITVPYNLDWSGSGGLVDTYYNEMLNIIETGARLECHLFWDEEKYINAKFRVPKYFSNPEHIKGYYILESIEGFDPLNAGMYKTVFLKVVPVDSIQFAQGYEADSDIVYKNNGTFGNIGTNTGLKNSIVTGSFGVGEGLKSSLAGQTVTGKFNEDAPGALSVIGNGSKQKASNSSLIDANGTKINNPERMQADGQDLYYEEVNGIKKYVY